LLNDDATRKQADPIGFSSNPCFVFTFLFLFSLFYLLFSCCFLSSYQDHGQESDVSNPPEHYIAKVTAIAEVKQLTKRWKKKQQYYIDDDGMTDHIRPGVIFCDSRLFLRNIFIFFFHEFSWHLTKTMQRRCVYAPKWWTVLRRPCAPNRTHTSSVSSNWTAFPRCSPLSSRWTNLRLTAAYTMHTSDASRPL
jgi:hypothetical protein